MVTPRNCHSRRHLAAIELPIARVLPRIAHHSQRSVQDWTRKEVSDLIAARMGVRSFLKEI